MHGYRGKFNYSRRQLSSEIQGSVADVKRCAEYKNSSLIDVIFTGYFSSNFLVKNLGHECLDFAWISNMGV